MGRLCKLTSIYKKFRIIMNLDYNFKRATFLFNNDKSHKKDSHNFGWKTPCFVKKKIVR